MKPERWQLLDQLFNSALKRTPVEWPAFLLEACAGDDSLRKEVEALLSAHAEADNFIEKPAFEVAAQSLANDQKESVLGEIIAHYKIVSSLGVGGMGEVYLAQDMQLGRRVALKLLPTLFTSETDRVSRFQQEARAASALNHPNIITIYEIGQFDDRHFIVTEFIDGETVRQRLRDQPGSSGRSNATCGTLQELREALNVAIQVADGLVAAHEAGIVHRDIKPENIMVRRRDGYVKVLDFGLAKLTEVAIDSEAPTKPQVKTSAGVVMGTIDYMSPEQARGENVDARTDIWSLGVVLYEMVAGSGPFERATPSEAIASILEREPAPLARYARLVPEELERIVSKALTKNREERYQTAKDLLIDLRRLKQRLEVQAEAERSTPHVLNDARSASTAGTTSAGTEAKTVRPTSTGGPLLTGIKRHRPAAAIAIVISLLILGAISLGTYKFLHHRQTIEPRFQALKFTKLNLPGNALVGSISTDGKYIAYVVDAAGLRSLWINQIATTSDVQIVPPAQVRYGRPVFSHDSNYVYYVVTDKDDPGGALYRIPKMGGTPRKLLVDIQSTISLSPDDKQFTFYRNTDEAQLLIVADADGKEQQLASRKGDEWFENNTPGFTGPAWSPDGKVIACGVGKASLGGLPVTVIVVQVEDGMEREVTSQRWLQIASLLWLGDGSAMMLGASMRREPYQIWRLSYPNGEGRQLTDDFRRYGISGVTADSGTMIGVEAEQLTSMWVGPDGDASRARQITSQEQGWIGMDLSWSSWTTDGKILYNSNATGNFDIWITNADGSDKKQLTFDPSFDVSPVMTPDGRYIVFASNRAGTSSGWDLWRMDADGGNPKQLANNIEDIGAQCSPDGRWVVYAGLTDGKAALWKVPIEGGDPVRMGDACYTPAVSPAGRWIACIDQNEHSDSHISIIPFQGGKPIKLLDDPQRSPGLRIRWMPDSRAISYVQTRGDVANIWSQPIDGGPARPETDFKDQLIFSFDWSRDGKQLVCTRGINVHTTFLITEAK